MAEEKTLPDSSARHSKGEQTRRTIISAAHGLFLERGYHGTSIRDIAVASGLTVGGIYAHWSDKVAIWSAVLNAFHPLRKLIPVFEELEADSFVGLFSQLAHRMVETLGTQRAALNLLFTEIVEFQGAHFASVFPQLFPSFVAALRKASATLKVPLTYPPEIIVRSFFGLIFSYFMTSIVLSGDLPSDDDALDTFVDIYLNGVSRNSAKKDGSK